MDKVGFAPGVLCLPYQHATPDATASSARGLAIKKVSSEYFHEQIYTTFFNDPVGGHRLTWWGANNCMWPNDFPRGKSIGPNPFWTSSRQAGHPYHATDSLLLKLEKQAIVRDRTFFYCSITEGANISSIFTRRGVSPCSNEYCAVVSSTLRLAAIPWRMSGVASALRTSGGSKPVSR